MIFVASRGPQPALRLFVRSNPAQYVEETSPQYFCDPAELLQIFAHHPKIPPVSSDEFELIRKFARREWPPLGEVARIYVGEVFDNAPNKKYLSDEAIGPVVARGANVDRYKYRVDASQGSPRYIRAGKFTADKARSEKLQLLQNTRVGVQRGAAVDMWRRLIACPIAAGQFSFDTVLLLAPAKIDLRVLMALLNSDAWEWLFRATSATNHVNEYDLADFRVPPWLLSAEDHRTKTIALLAEQCMNSDDVRRTNSQHVSDASPDRRLDEQIMQQFALTGSEKEIVRRRL